MSTVNDINTLFPTSRASRIIKLTRKQSKKATNEFLFYFGSLIVVAVTTLILAGCINCFFDTSIFPRWQMPVEWCGMVR